MYFFMFLRFLFAFDPACGGNCVAGSFVFGFDHWLINVHHGLIGGRRDRAESKRQN
jgi:hypothetical protein